MRCSGPTCTCSSGCHCCRLPRTGFERAIFSAIPVAVYGAILLVAAISYFVLQQTIFAADGVDSTLREAVGADLKGKISPLIYVVGIATAFVQPFVAVGIYTLVALIWLIPDSRIESRFRA